MNKNLQKNIIIYQAKNGAIELRGDFKHDNIWATQAQISDVFGSERSVVTKHIRNILKNKELDEKSVCAKFAHTGNDGKTYQVQFYNLDVILGVGYRTNSKEEGSDGCFGNTDVEIIMNKSETQAYISNIENGRMNPTLSCPPVALCKGG